MDDCCAVCAEPLEWVAYGPCAHRDVCSTCVVRLRNVCGDRCCCICKTECNLVFVTKAMGDYTKTVDFSSLPVDVREGKIGSYWYHEATQAFFDDIDHYRMIKAMCTFSCSVCDEEGHQNDGGRRKANFRSLEQLKGHLSYRHRLMMCKLCLEGRKVFICEQKLYTKAQLNQHISTGDSEVDGTESERGGFMGHPTCEFCRTPFYGDNELYTHMSTEHFTCHFCQRQNPGQFEYFRNYDDLEIHFRQGHFLCEDEGCLAKKFMVFKSEAELKRHNAKEHGGRMSRSKRNAVLQIPTSFRYRRPNESESRRGRGRAFSFRQDSSSSDNQLSMAIQASLETANADPLPSSSSSAQQTFVDEDIDPLIPPFESLAVDSHQPPSRYLQAVSHNYSSGPIQDSSFPPLSALPNNNQQGLQQDGNGLPQNTMAARLRQKNAKTTKVNVAQAWPAANRGQNFPSISSIHSRPTVNITNASVPGYYSSTNVVTPTGPTSSSYSSSVSWAGSSNSKNPSNNGKMKHSTSASKLGEIGSFDPVSDFPPVSSAQTQRSGGSSTQAVNNGLSWAGSSNSRNPSNNGKMKHSTSASKLSESGSFDPDSDFPPVSVAQTQKSGGSSTRQGVKVEDVQTANKSLVERMRAALDNDQDKFAAFKEISQDYRLGSIDTSVYFDYIKKFGLLDLVPDLARLCPDPYKQQELLDTYNSTLCSNNESQEMFWGNSKSGKGKKVINAESSSSRSKEALADNVLETVRRLQSNYRDEGEVEVLEKDGYRASIGKLKATVEERPIQLGTSNQGSSGDGGGNKKGKKTSKFHRVRLGDGSVGALLDLRNPANDPVQDSGDDASETPGLPVRGVWRGGGGQKLFGSTKK